MCDAKVNNISCKQEILESSKADNIKILSRTVKFEDKTHFTDIYPILTENYITNAIR